MNHVSTSTLNGSLGNTAFIMDVAKFHKLFNHPILEQPDVPNEKRVALRVKLLREEIDELEEAANNKDIVEVADALGDTMYVLCGAILEFGLGNKFYEIFQEIQRSNMTKACTSIEEAEETQLHYLNKKGVQNTTIVSYDKNKTFVVEDENGKTLKSINYSPADIKTKIIL